MIELLDTHQHLLYRDKLRYDWADALPTLSNRDFTIADYQQLTADRAVKASIFMEVDADDYKAETRFVSELAQNPDSRIRGLISSCRPEDDAGFDSWLEECAALPVVGFRRILHEAPDGLSTTDRFRNNIRKIGRQDKVFDMVFRADQLAIAHDLATSCDEMVLVLDHCGVPDIANGDFEDWKQAVSRIARLSHVNGKLSGVLAYCEEGSANLQTIKPYIDHMIESFGPQRLVWGSDWPVVNLKSDLATWIDIFRELIAALSIDEQVAISSGNAKSIYSLASD